MTRAVLLISTSTIFIACLVALVLVVATKTRRLLAYGFSILVTLSALTAEEWAHHRHERWRDLAMVVLAAVIENIGYRQLTVIWRLQGWWASLRNRKQVWGVMTRTGFDEASP